jgi:hypothetical protein
MSEVVCLKASFIDVSNQVLSHIKPHRLSVVLDKP